MNNSLGDAVINSAVPLHFGTFGGLAIKALWAALGLTPPLMFTTGLIMWWNRVVKREYRKRAERQLTVTHS